MAGGGELTLLARDGAWSRVAGRFWRAVPAGQEARVLDGTVRAGRYNRPGQRTLYLSASPEGVAAAMARYAPVERAIVALEVEAERLIDLRDGQACLVHGVDARRAKEDWIAALDRGDVPASWEVADKARAVGATGLIDRSRRVPALWHLVLFDWKEGAAVAVRA